MNLENLVTSRNPVIKREGYMYMYIYKYKYVCVYIYTFLFIYSIIYI